MRHATSATLDRLEPLLARVRAVNGLVEKKRGVFYRRSKAFLHFHEDPSGLHADVRLSAEFVRFRVETPAEHDDLIVAIHGALDAGQPRPGSGGGSPGCLPPGLGGVGGSG